MLKEFVKLLGFKRERPSIGGVEGCEHPTILIIKHYTQCFFIQTWASIAATADMSASFCGTESMKSASFFIS
jgi:hypothetical protein